MFYAAFCELIDVHKLDKVCVNDFLYFISSFACSQSHNWLDISSKPRIHLTTINHEISFYFSLEDQLAKQIL